MKIENERSLYIYICFINIEIARQNPFILKKEFPRIFFRNYLSSDYFLIFLLDFIIYSIGATRCELQTRAK